MEVVGVFFCMCVCVCACVCVFCFGACVKVCVFACVCVQLTGVCWSCVRQVRQLTGVWMWQSKTCYTWCYDYDPHLFMWLHGLACHPTDVMQHAIAVPHIHALIDGKAIVGKPHWMADTRNEETASLVALLLFVRARMKEQKLLHHHEIMTLITHCIVGSIIVICQSQDERTKAVISPWDNDTDNMKKNMQYFLLHSKCCLSRSDTLYKLLWAWLPSLVYIHYMILDFHWLSTAWDKNRANLKPTWHSHSVVASNSLIFHSIWL